jgi:hypothetical protein
MHAMRETLSHYLQTVSAFQDAAIHDDITMEVATGTALRDARVSRENAFQAFANHLLNHNRAARASGQ